MDENTERTPHPEEPAEGGTDMDGTDMDGTDMDSTGTPTPPAGPHDGDPATIPAHNSAPDGYAPHESGTDAARDDSTSATDAARDDDGTGGAIQGDSPLEESTGGAIQGDAGPHRDAHLGGDATTEEQLEADTEVDEDTLKTLDPNDPPA